jgi:hypothetical protein
LIEGGNHFGEQHGVDVARSRGDQHAHLRRFARHHCARHPCVPTLMPDWDQHVFEASPLGRDRHALEHFQAGSDLQGFAIIVRIAARWDKPAKFKLSHDTSDLCQDRAAERLAAA